MRCKRREEHHGGALPESHLTDTALFYHHHHYDYSYYVYKQRDYSLFEVSAAAAPASGCRRSYTSQRETRERPPPEAWAILWEPSALICLLWSSRRSFHTLPPLFSSPLVVTGQRGSRVLDNSRPSWCTRPPWPDNVMLTASTVLKKAYFPFTSWDVAGKQWELCVLPILEAPFTSPITHRYTGGQAIKLL